MENTQIHDTVFRDYFNDKARLLSLCNALLDTNYDDPVNVEITTLEGTFYSALKNDLSCLLGGYFITIIEHQSTKNGNMPFRCLKYLVELLEKHIAQNKLRKQLMTSARVNLPHPRFFVMYEGGDTEPILSEQKLSDSFGGDDSAIELKVIVVNINRLNKEVGEAKRIAACRELMDYVFFMRLIDKYKKTMPPKQAVKKAIDECRKLGIMADYLAKKGEEVFDMLSYQWNAKDAQEAWVEYGREEGKKEGRKKGREEGRAEGRIQTKSEMVKNMKLAGADVAFIAKVSGWSAEQIAAV